MADINFSFWAVLILIGAAQGFFLSIYLTSVPSNRAANKWLGFLLIAISLHLLEYAANISGLTLRFPIFIAITYPLLFCMGPCYFFYCRFLLDKNYRVTAGTILHFLPSLCVLALMLPFYSMPDPEKIAYLGGLYKNGVMKIPAGQLVFMATHVIQTAIYLLVSYTYVRKKEKELKKVSAHVLVILKLGWLRAFSFYFAIYLLLYVFLVIILTFIGAFQIEIDYAMLLITSFSLYAISYAAIRTPELFQVQPELELHPKTEKTETFSLPPRNGNKFPELRENLVTYMDRHKPYLKSDLKISELADSLSVPYYQLSQLINDEFGVNFYDFVNTYRVEEAKKLLVEDVRNYKILAIAYEVGFNSKATFNRVFKKITDLTPSEYKQKFSPPQG
jgi:AraC-like DNA-binding protein